MSKSILKDRGVLQGWVHGSLSEDLSCSGAAWHVFVRVVKGRSGEKFHVNSSWTILGFLILSVLRKSDCFKHAHVWIRRRVVCYENHAEWILCRLSVQWQAPVETGMWVSRDGRTSCAVFRAVGAVCTRGAQFSFGLLCSSVLRSIAVTIQWTCCVTHMTRTPQWLMKIALVIPAALSSHFLCHPHTQIGITLFHGVQKSIPNRKPSPNRVLIVFFLKLLFPYLSCQRMTLQISIKVDESKCLDIPICEFSKFCEHVLFGFKQILRLLLALRNLEIWRWYP